VAVCSFSPLGLHVLLAYTSDQGGNTGLITFGRSCHLLSSKECQACKKRHRSLTAPTSETSLLCQGSCGPDGFWNRAAHGVRSSERTELGITPWAAPPGSKGRRLRSLPPATDYPGATGARFALRVVAGTLTHIG
jgi:hypothetical protein